MQLSEITFAMGRPVDGYGPNFFRVAGEVFEGNLAILPNSCGPWAGFEDPSPFVDAAKDLDVVFVGTGAQIAHIPPNFRASPEGVGFEVEIMNSPTASRTSNILLPEGPRIGLALTPV
mgnify:CR=1 FL=1